LSTVRVRAFNHTGPGQSTSMLVPGLARRVADAERSGGSKVSVGNLDVVRDLCDVRDVVRAYRLLVERGEPGDAYNVCSGRGVTVHDVATMMLSMSDAPLQLVVDPELVRPVDVPRLVGSADRLHAATGWTPEIDLDRTLADVLATARA
jgi:GDP-4-dehydro-6-deoxy-D-mannose reductase